MMGHGSKEWFLLFFSGARRFSSHRRSSTGKVSLWRYSLLPVNRRAVHVVVPSLAISTGFRVATVVRTF